MVSIKQNKKIQLKRASQQYWNDTDPILETGEPGYNTDNKSFKIGDGQTAWSKLPYQQETSENYILNSSFDIWQRGTSFTAAGYTADRWYTSSSITATTISRQNRDAGAYGSYVLRLTSNAITNSVSVYQPLESVDVKRIAGKTVTFSFYAYSSNGAEFLTYSIRKNATANVASGAGWTDIAEETTVMSSSDANDLRRYSITADIPFDGTAEGLAVRFSTSNITNGSSISIFDVQLEESPAPTKFRPRNNTIATEFVSCQRYYYRWNGGPVNIGGGDYYAATQFYANLLHPVELRVSPTSNTFTKSSTGAVVVYSGTGGLTSTNITFSNSSVRSIEILFTTAGGTAGYAGHIVLSASQWLAVDAELA